MNRRDLLKLGLAGLTAGTCVHVAQAQTQAPRLPEARYDKLPPWRGFNLLEKFNGQNRKFVENDFRWIRDFGFNFVRLPMDYRMWIIDRDWRKINERVLEEIDEAVQFGEKYGIHINMNFHRAPGYTVARPAEEKSVWTDPEAREVCAMHWATFAKRYKGIPNSRVSFNLFNEPASVDNVMAQCLEAHRIIISAIRAEDPERLIICDGYEWGTKPLLGLVDQKVAMATRGYAPSEISHYKASWVNSEDFPEPSWPTVTGNGLLLQPNKGEIEEKFRQPMQIEGPFSSATKLRMLVGTVSNSTSLVVEADGKVVFKHDFKPGPGEGEWKQVVFQQQWNTYQNIYDKDYEAVIPSGTRQVVVRAEGGDWLTLKEISLNNGRGDAMVHLSPGWGQEPSRFRYDGSAITGGLLETKDRNWLKRTMIEPWQAVQRQGVGVMVGEFGSHQFTPHDVVLRWMGDMLANWKEAGWGYALWNFRGSFGIMDSGRTDIVYEDFNGHKLDRKMLQLLQG